MKSLMYRGHKAAALSYTPRVSVIMPAYNVEKYIGDAIESILTQTFTDFEFIIINDGSTDRTAEIIRKYAKQDKRIKFIDNKENRGFVSRLNECLDLARGEYIAKMDSDDLSMPMRLEKQVAFLDSNPDFGMVGVGVRKFGTKNKTDIRPKYVGIADFVYSCATTVFMARREIIEKYSLRFDADYFAAEDRDFYYRFACVSKIANIQEVLYLYRYHGNNVSIQKFNKQCETDERIRHDIVHILTGNKYMFDKLTKMYRWVRICGLPIIKIKTYSLDRFKYCLFGLFQMIMIENRRVYLFGFVNIGSIK